MKSAFSKYMHRNGENLFAKKYLNEYPREYVNCIVCGSSNNKKWYSMGPFVSKICKDCKTRFVSPRYNDDQLDEYYSESLFTTSKDYEGVHHNMLDPAERKRKRIDMAVEIDTVLSHCPEAGKVLDIGCQTGIFLEALPDKIEKYGVERSKWAGEYSRSIIKGDIRIGKIEEIEYPENHFDVINMSYVVEHLQSPLQTMEKIVSWLKKDGVIIISVPNFLSPCSIIFREFYRLADPRQHIYLTTKKSMAHLLKCLGVSIEKTHYPYWNTPYCTFKNNIRLLQNSIRRILLPTLLKKNKIPTPDKIVSPPFLGNILIVTGRKQ